MKFVKGLGLGLLIGYAGISTTMNVALIILLADSISKKPTIRSYGKRDVNYCNCKH
jgi:hypothetical protein